LLINLHKKVNLFFFLFLSIQKTTKQIFICSLVKYLFDPLCQHYRTLFVPPNHNTNENQEKKENATVFYPVLSSNFDLEEKISHFRSLQHQKFVKAFQEASMPLLQKNIDNSEKKSFVNQGPHDSFEDFLSDELKRKIFAEKKGHFLLSGLFAEFPEIPGKNKKKGEEDQKNALKSQIPVPLESIRAEVRILHNQGF
jgi:hypothetical protein